MCQRTAWCLPVDCCFSEQQIKNNRTPLHQTSVDTMSRSIKIFNTCVSEIQYYCPQFLCYIPILLQYLLPSSLSEYSHNINLILASLSTTVVSKPNFFGDQLWNICECSLFITENLRYLNLTQFTDTVCGSWSTYSWMGRKKYLTPLQTSLYHSRF
jgi:hypothetical protein